MSSSAFSTASEGEASLYLTFDDNSLLPALFGQHDQHLARIEQALGVWVTSRGNHVALSGSADATNSAKKVFLELYDMLKRELAVDIAEVEAVLRTAANEVSDQAETSKNESLIRTPRRTILPRSPNQTRYVRALMDAELVFGIGPAGTGKTYLAVAVALSLMARGHVERLVLSRPAVEAGERLGFLPGDLRDKVDPYLRPLYDALYDMMPADKVNNYLRGGDIEVAPLAFMRGRTLSNAFVILDEAQNTTPVQMKMFLTRLGENSRMAVTGDLSQIDLPSGMQSGLAHGLSIVGELEGSKVVKFANSDVVRHPLVTKIVKAYDVHERSHAAHHSSRDPAGKSQNN
ncbi:MAG: PhoH-like protein [Alphaproteobacteria bacterium MarineAlpha9_Bin7]|nr:MAG: PhoH-like protein [Alphaproteobacteria bacterium MarineAlpha9_Bin7]